MRRVSNYINRELQLISNSLDKLNERELSTEALHTLSELRRKLYQLAVVGNTLQEDIYAVTGITPVQLVSKHRDHPYVYARMLYTHHRHKQGLPLKDIAAELDKNRSTVYHYLQSYDRGIAHWPEFRVQAERLEKLLDSVI